jgi:arylamine N-acetyltransferase
VTVNLEDTPRTIAADNTDALARDPASHAEAVRLFAAYFKLRPANPSLRHLCKLLRCFSEIPYENISKIIRLQANLRHRACRIRLPSDVITDHIEHRLGGTCFSLTFFLQAILQHYGYVSYSVMADMRAGTNSHCCLIAILDAVKYLIDPGYLLTRPMAINPFKPLLYRTEYAGVELRFDAGVNSYDLFTCNGSERKWRYRFTDRPVSGEAFFQHWLDSFDWNSMHNLCLTKVREDGLLYLRKDFMRETTCAGKTNIDVKRNLHAAIQSHFGIEKQLVEQAQAALAANLDWKKASGLWLPRKGKAKTPVP